MQTYVLFSIIISSLLMTSVATVDAAQLDIKMNPDMDSSPFEIKYQKTIFIEYPDGGQVADMLRDTDWMVSSTSMPQDPGSISLAQKLNQNLVSDGSQAQVSNLTIDYTSTLTGNELNAAIDYKVVIQGDLVGYTIRASEGQTPALLDLGWRGLTIEGPFMLGDVEINQPFSSIQSQSPEVAAMIAGSEAEDLLHKNIIDADFIRDQPLTNWHFLFDPTGINADAAQFGLSAEISGFVLSRFTMGESSIREGIQVEREFHAPFMADMEYSVRTVQSADNANVDVIGFAQRDIFDNVEIFGVYATQPEGYADPGTGGFPVTIVYGMAGLAAVGGIAFFAYSNRQMKKEAGQGQTGIDPSRLVGYQTSASSGGYQTNRGEAQLADASTYQQTRSVYESQTKQPPASENTSAPVTRETTCACATSAEMNSQCDCDMQGSCLCDASCTCTTSLCKEHSQTF